MNKINTNTSVKAVSFLTDAYKNVPIGVNQKLTMEFHPTDEISLFVVGVDIEDCRNGYKDWCSKNLQDDIDPKV